MLYDCASIEEVIPPAKHSTNPQEVGPVLHESRKKKAADIN